MRKMRDSGIDWVGAIPNHWRVSKIKQIVRWKSVKGQPDLPVLSLYRDYGVIPKDSRDDNHNVTSLDTSGYKVVEHGDLVINKMKAWQGSLAVSEYNGIVSPAYHICKITSENICKKYLHYLLRDASYLPEYMRLSTGLRVGQWDLSFDDFKNIPFLVPPLAEQERIAALLDAECAEIDAVLEKTRASIEEYKKLEQAVITQAVTKGIRGDRPMKDSGIEWIGEIPAEWGVVPHKRIMHKVKEICEQYNGEDIISLTVNGVVKRDLTAGGKMPTSFDGYQYVEPNDLLLCLFDIDVTPRCVGVVRDYGVTSPAYSRFVMHDGYYNAYYDYLLRMIDGNKVFVHLSKNLRSSLTESDFGAIKTCAPPLAEQKCIAAFLDVRCDEIDALIAKKQQYLTEIENYKKSLIYEYVTGKKEVKTSVLAD
mgnify:FL=1